MTATQTVARLLIQLGVIIFAARLFGGLARLCRLPSVLGELLAGILLGPYLLGHLPINLHGLHHGLFPLEMHSGVPVSMLLYGLATIGSVILLFMSGLETDLRIFFRYSVVGTVVGFGGLVVSYAFGVLAGLMFLPGAHWMDPRCIFLGVLCTATSVGVTARILSEQKSMETPEGVTIMAAAVIDDVAGIVCLAIGAGVVAVQAMGRSMDWNLVGMITVKSFGIWLGVSALGLACAHRLSHYLKGLKSLTEIAVLTFGMAMLLAGFFEYAGLAMIVGAFVMGISLSKTDIAFNVREALEPVYAFLVPIFFVVTGMLVDVRVLGDRQVLLMGLVYSVLAILAKLIGCALPALCMNFNGLGALRIGIGMIPRGEVALIIAGIAVTSMMPDGQGGMVPIFDSKLFGVAIIMTLVTVIIPPPLLTRVLAIRRKGVRKEVPEPGVATTSFNFAEENISSFVFREIVADFTREGFFNSGLQEDAELIQFRRGAHTITLRIADNVFTFESAEAEVSLVKTIVYEAVVELHHKLLKLRQLADPANIHQEIFGDQKSLVTADASGSFQAVRMDKLIGPQNIMLELQASDRDGALREMLGAIKAASPQIDLEQCFADIVSREEIASTYQGDGIALPHGRTHGVNQLHTVIARKSAGLPFDGDETHQARIIILSLCPKEASGPYLQYIVQVARILADGGNCADILGASSAAEIRDVLLRKA